MLIAPWRIGQPPTGQARVHASTARCGLDCGTGQLATHSAPTEHARVHCPVRVKLWCGSTREALLAHVARARALRGADLVLVRANSRRASRPRSTRACTARCGLGCGAGRLATRSSRARRPRLGRTTTASCRRLRLRIVGDTAFDSRGALAARGFEPSKVRCSALVTRGPRANHPVENQTTAHRARTHALRGADLVEVRANSQRALFQLVGRGTAAQPLNQVSGCGFDPSVMPRSIPAANGSRAHRPVMNRPSARRASARVPNGAD